MVMVRLLVSSNKNRKGVKMHKILTSNYFILLGGIGLAALAILMGR